MAAWRRGASGDDFGSYRRPRNLNIYKAAIWLSMAWQWRRYLSESGGSGSVRRRGCQ
jgi:hypothetical protein